MSDQSAAITRWMAGTGRAAVARVENETDSPAVKSISKGAPWEKGTSKGGSNRGMVGRKGDEPGGTRERQNGHGTVRKGVMIHLGLDHGTAVHGHTIHCPATTDK